MTEAEFYVQALDYLYKIYYCSGTLLALALLYFAYRVIKFIMDFLSGMF